MYGHILPLRTRNVRREKFRRLGYTWKANILFDGSTESTNSLGESIDEYERKGCDAKLAYPAFCLRNAGFSEDNNRVALFAKERWDEETVL